jgi:hypothetical protein
MATITLRGSRDVQARLDAIAALPHELQGSLKKFVGRQAMQVLSEAKKRAPIGPSRSDPDYPGRAREERRRKAAAKARARLRAINAQLFDPDAPFSARKRRKSYTYADLLSTVEELNVTKAEGYGVYTPGLLRKGAMVDVIGGMTAPIVATVSFGGRAADYAEVQHERADFKHPIHKGTGSHAPSQDHFLYGAPDSAWEILRPGIHQKIEAEVNRLARKALSGGNL